MNGPQLHCILFLGVWAITIPSSLAQGDTTLLDADDLTALVDAPDDPIGVMEMYEPLNGSLGGDSIRMCQGYACIGWVEDHYPDGSLKHRGYYKDGQLLVYRNYHPDGKLEREFKLVDNLHCFMRTYHDNGGVRTEVTYLKGRAVEYSDFYPSGQLRYREEKHHKEPYYLVMDLFAPSGTPISTLHLVDKKNVIFDQVEYWANGKPRHKGQARFNAQRRDTQRIGDWVTYDRDGGAVSREHYVDGKVFLAEAIVPGNKLP